MNHVDLLDRYTEQAQRALALAEDEARQFQHSAVGTEHLLLGLLRVREGVVARILEEQGVTLLQVRQAVEKLKGRGPHAVQGELGLTPHAQSALKLAIAEADRRHPRTTEPMPGTKYVPLSEAQRVVQDGILPDQWAALGMTIEQVRQASAEAQQQGQQVVGLEIETGMAPYANQPASGEWHHPLIIIKTEDLLLGMLNVADCTAVQILQADGKPGLKDFRYLLFLQHVSTLQTTNQNYAQQFTRSARRAWQLAWKEARQRQDHYIGSHHLLAGLLGAGDGAAARALTEQGVSLDKLRGTIESSLGRVPKGDAVEIVLTPQLKNTIELASNQARQLNQRAISTAHLLLILLRDHDGQGVEAGLLKSLGVDLYSLQTRLLELADDTADTLSTSDNDEDTDAADIPIQIIEQGLQSRELDKTILAIYPFVAEARIVLEQARIAALQQGQQVGPEHLLLGLSYLTFQQRGPVGKRLKEAGIDFASVQTVLQQRPEQGEKGHPVVLLLSAMGRACLLLAAAEAEKQDGPGAQIKSEHLLLGLLDEPTGVIAQLLQALGTSSDTIRQTILL
ncbi:Clp protease N-terminal domain-containing protein [Dictyobacter kobayashii]|uniref:Clp R domain-containing protein n=1 Tax=Dictyobacter kobayashii TaxID=2014872 RepID=A0A402AQN5_9CHLR|nr:Clp protease N-terminal domain-containing protein [Dictyobacter kobayashii]GCE21389.1 hypothetical protein KDK_51890 [Dictyobacter kobayashii]